MDSKNSHDAIKFKKYGKYMNIVLKMPNFKEINGVIYKLCTKCKKYKPMSSEFFPCRKNVKCGFGSYCKDCDREKEKRRIRVPAFDENGKLYCCTCKTYKSISEFNKGDKNKTRNDYSRECKTCEAKRKSIQRASMNKDDKNYFLKHLLYGCKTRSLQNNLNFDLNVQFIVDLYNKQNGKCAISGLPMTTRRQSGKNPYNVSIDRIVPSLGYTKENVRLVCSHVNMMRSNLEDSQLLEFCKAVLEYDKLKKNK